MHLYCNRRKMLAEAPVIKFTYSLDVQVIHVSVYVLDQIELYIHVPVLKRNSEVLFWLPEWFLQLPVHMCIEACYILSTKLQRILPRILSVLGPQGLPGTHRMIHRLLRWQTQGSASTPVIQAKLFHQRDRYNVSVGGKETDNIMTPNAPFDALLTYDGEDRSIKKIINF